jgi:flagellar basal body rod protein FlgG
MFNAYIDALNSTLTFEHALGKQQENLLNFNTLGYQEKREKLAPSSFGVILAGEENNGDVGFTTFIKGEKVTKMAIDSAYPNAFFLTKDGDKEYLTQLGDFKYSRQQRAANTYIGQPYEERTYLTTQDGYLVMGYPIGRGPTTQAKRFKDPLSAVDPVLFGESPIETPEKKIASNEPLQKGPQVPIDLTRGSNGLYLDRYEDLRTSSKGIIEGLRKGLWVPLYQVSLYSIPNPTALARIGDTAYRVETEKSGLRQSPPPDVKVRAEHVEKSNVNLKYNSYLYKNMRNNLNLAVSLQRSNNQIFQQFQQLLNAQ